MGFRVQGLHSIILCSWTLPGGQESLSWAFLMVQMVKNLPAMQENAGLIPGSGRSQEGNGSALQYSCLENCMDRGAWQATDHGITNNQTGLSD